MSSETNMEQTIQTLKGDNQELMKENASLKRQIGGYKAANERYRKNLENLEFLNTYRQKNYVLGKNVSVLKQGKIINQGTALEIDDNCHLVVKLSSGEMVHLSSGEVSVKV